MDKKGREFWVGFIVLLVGLNLFLVFRISGMRKQIDMAKAELNSMEQKNDLMNTRIEELAAENQNIQDENTRLRASMAYYRKKALYPPSLSSKEITELKKKGLKDPLKDIKTDLMKHVELIPYKGVLGGKMEITTEGDIHILSTKRVRAYFEDGHIGGWMILEYRVSNGKIMWNILDSYLNTPNNTGG